MNLRVYISALSALFVLTLGVPAFAQVETESIEYVVGGTTLKGYIAYDKSLEGKRPGVMVVHEWWGLNDYAKQRARDLAELGYVALAVDMYGEGQVAEDRAAAAKLAGEVRGDKQLMRQRARAGLDTLKQHPRVDADRVAAIGYCFGGTTVLELAYSGAKLAGVVSFHGGITVPTEEEAEQIEAAVLVLHGADDPMVPAENIAAFQERMAAGDVDWQFVSYGGAVHTFTNPAAGDDKSTGSAYHEAAAKRSWQHMKLFFDEVFAAKKS
jgi:dienelactone hydrolase